MVEENPLAPKGLGLLRERYLNEGLKDIEHLQNVMKSIKIKGKHDRSYMKRFIDTTTPTSPKL
jgi:hypothetical protein